MELSDTVFDKLITRAMNELPQHYISNMQNVVIVMADDPSDEQRDKMRLDEERKLLLGLFEGVNKMGQSGGWSGMLPSKITLFKHPLMLISDSEESLFQNIKRTLWHEIAHYYGLSHEMMAELQEKKS